MGLLPRWVGFLLLLAAISTPFASDIGHVTEVENVVELIRSGEVFALEEGVAVSADDVVRTGDDAIAQMEMQDGSVLDIGPASELHIAAYQLEDNLELNSGEISLLTGWLRFITSKLNANRSFDIYTPTMAIGIRGTEGLIGIDEESSQLELASGQVTVIGIDTQGNELQDPQAIHAGEFVQHNRDGSRQKLAQSPESFRLRKHPRFKRALVRKIQRLTRRGVLPKKLRNATVDDLKTLLKSNPKIRKRLLNHLKKRMQDPEFRQRMKKFLKNNPTLRKKLKSSKAFQQATRKELQQVKKRQERQKRQELLKQRQERQKNWRDRQ